MGCDLDHVKEKADFDKLSLAFPINSPLLRYWIGIVGYIQALDCIDFVSFYPRNKVNQKDLPSRLK